MSELTERLRRALIEGCPDRRIDCWRHISLTLAEGTILLDVLDRAERIEAALEDADTLLRVIGKRGLYPGEEDWNLIVSAAEAYRDARGKAK